MFLCKECNSLAHQAHTHSLAVYRGMNGNTYQVARIILKRIKLITYNVAVQFSHDGKVLGVLRLSLPGEHNLFNATIALAACVACGLNAGDAIDALNRFTGVDRRMTVMGKYNGATVVDDYGQHPTEIRATLKASGRSSTGPSIFKLPGERKCGF